MTKDDDDLLPAPPRTWAERWASILLVWIHGRRAKRLGWNVARTRAHVDRTLAGLIADVAAVERYQRTEADILNMRLSRRYDPGMALNEATERAIAAKKHAASGLVVEDCKFTNSGNGTGVVVAGPIKLDGSDESWARLAAAQRANPDRMLPHNPELTDRQQAALEVQKRTQRRNVERN